MLHLARTATMLALLAGLTSRAWAQAVTVPAGDRVARELAARASLGEATVRQLRAPSGTMPLGFYRQIMFGHAGDFYLSAISGGIYTATPYRLMHFDASGSLLSGLGPSSPQAVPGGIAFLAGMEGPNIVAISKWLGKPTSDDSGWTIYRLSPDLKIVQEGPFPHPGVLSNNEVFYVGPGEDPNAEPLNCVQVYGLDGVFRRSFSPCPAGTREAPLQTSGLAMDGGDIFWTLFAEQKVRVTAVDGVDAGSFGQAPKEYVTMDQAMKRALSARPRDLPDRDDVMPLLTPVKSIVLAGGALVVSYRKLDPRPDRFWNEGSIVQIYDRATRTLVDEFTVVATLVGRDSAGSLCWMTNDQHGEQTDHWLITTPVTLQPPKKE